MTIKRIRIQNIKGISDRDFELSIIPNRPSLLVAPNGFGKSSFAAAFLSLQTNRLAVHEDNSHKNDTDLPSKLTVEYIDADNIRHSLEATEASNELNDHFDCFVINSQIKAKGVGRTFGGRTSVSASISVEPVVLIETIPNRESFGYAIRHQQELFGLNFKILPNISEYFNNTKFIFELGKLYHLLDRLSLVRNQRAIDEIKQQISHEQGTAVVLRSWLLNNKLDELEGIQPLREISELILNSNLGVDSKDISFLSALQIHKLYEEDKAKFKKATKYSNYKLEKNEYIDMLSAFNTSWCSIKPTESGRKLLVEFPKANQISNGQRDVITFVALLYRAQKKLNSRNSILVIDEVFDYLDDANLVAVQYYITKLIDKYKSEGKRLYPLILTHLNPYYFKNFAFSKQKTYYLDKRDVLSNPAFVKLLRNRNEEVIKNDVSKYLLHFHTENINKRDEFRVLNLRETWGEGSNFKTFVEGELGKYLNDEEEFDPLAICCAVRIKVEEITFNQILDQEQKNIFLTTFKTRDKLSFAEESGVSIPEYFYLLGIIYNDGMHWREGQDNISPIAAKLENQTIKKLISEIYV